MSADHKGILRTSMNQMRHTEPLPASEPAAPNRQNGSPPSVALLVDTATGWGRRLIQGVHNYVQKHRPWRLRVEARGQHESFRLPPGWTGDGVIARVNSPQLLRHLKETDAPVVNVSGIELSENPFPTVALDPVASVRLALDHFVERGFEHFAYCGPPALPYVEEHRRAFESQVDALGKRCHVHHPRRRGGARSYEAQMEHLADWLESLPRPVAVLCWATQRGHEVVEACNARGLDVPADVAVLCGDDDDLLNELATPPLSGILVPSEQIGYEAAAMLDAIMSGEPCETDRLLLDPTAVETRQSTDTLAIGDPEIADAVRFIRENWASPIQVADILRRLPVSRRSLERRFVRYLGRSPSEEIRRVRLERAVPLLANTDLSMAEVATRSGLGSPQYLARIFRRKYGVTPIEYRRRLQGR